MAGMDPKPGDVVTLANARWAVVSAESRELRLLRLNEPAESEPQRERPYAPNSLSIDQVADELGITPKTVREYCRTGQLKGRKVGSSWRILRSENPVLATA